MAKLNWLDLAPIGFGKRGPIYPILGGDDSADAAAQAAAAAAQAAADKAAADKAAADQAAAAQAAKERGFPENTPVAEMTAEQQVAYWKHQSRQHESRNKALGVTPEQLQELRDKAKRADELEYDLKSDKDKAVADAAKAAQDKADAQYRPLLVEANIKAAAVGRIDPEKLQAALGPLDKNYFLAADGSVDTDKVTGWLDSTAPAQGNGSTQHGRGPSPTGQGNRGNSQSGKPSLTSGRDLYRSKFAKKS